MRDIGPMAATNSSENMAASDALAETLLDTFSRFISSALGDALELELVDAADGAASPSKAGS